LFQPRSKYEITIAHYVTEATLALGASDRLLMLGNQVNDDPAGQEPCASHPVLPLPDKISALSKKLRGVMADIGAESTKI
jgi:hypothetical protein